MGVPCGQAQPGVLCPARGAFQGARPWLHPTPNPHLGEGDRWRMPRSAQSFDSGSKTVGAIQLIAALVRSAKRDARSINPKSICHVGDGHSGRCASARVRRSLSATAQSGTSVAWTDTIAFEPSAERAQIVVSKIESGRSRPHIRIDRRAQGQFCCARSGCRAHRSLWLGGHCGREIHPLAFRFGG
jgi:hypothetical protein